MLDGLVAAMYGPSELRTTIKGAEVRIVQETAYPLTDQVTFYISIDAPIKRDYCGLMEVIAS